MEHYPDIQRQQGTLFFIPNGDRSAIAISIERLIDLLDAMDDDPDGEDGGDLEPTQGWPNAGQRVNEAMCCDDEREQDNADCEPSLGAAERHPNGMSWSDAAHTHTQARWGEGMNDDREDDGDDLEPSLLCQDYRNGRVEVDLEGDGSDDEYSHGWTGHIDQNIALMNCCDEWVGEGEPDLGWSGHGTGWRDGDDPQALEASQLGDHELEFDAVDDGAGFFDRQHGGHRSLGVDPALLPDEFNSTCEGDCLEPLVPNGARLHFDRRLPVHFDQLVMIVRKPGTYPKGDHQAVVKRLIADLRGTPWQGWPEGGVIAEMLNPHRVLFYPAHTVLALIACTGPAADAVGPRLTAGDILARHAAALAEGRPAC